MSIQERDSKGRFRVKRWREIEAWIAADNERAEKIVRALDAIGIDPEKREILGIKKLESGNWRIGYEVGPMLLGLGFGLALALNRTAEESRPLLALVCDAAGLEKSQTTAGGSSA